jgi:predicted GIY-YIG superfamily endonuclease
MIYNLGHIYVIWDCEDHNLTYYGSTNDLNRRINEHKNPGNKCMSKKIIERGNYEYAILETYENIDEYDLVERERWYILNKPCVNKKIPHRTSAEYYKDNKKKNSNYYLDYYQNNKDKMLDVAKKYYEKNKEKIKKKFVCECGGKYTLAKKARHEKSKKHQRYINITNQLH